MASDSVMRLHHFFVQTYSKLRFKFGLLLPVTVAALLCLLVQSSANAQAVTWTRTDLGTTGATGTYSYSAGTFTIAGAGSGIGGTADNFTYVSTPTSGNVELIAKVTSQTNTSNYANAGLMIKDSLTSNGAMAMVGVTPGNGVNFTYRTAGGLTSSMVLGPSITAPLFLRLVRSQNSVAGYQSSDGINWSLVGTCQMSLPGAFYIGFGVTSAVSGTLSTAVFTNENFMINVPQRSANLQAWFRADSGVTYSAGKISQIIDQSGNGNNASQSNSSKQPTLATSALNGLPAIQFNGTSQFLSLGPGFANFNSGASIFIVSKPTTVTNNTRFFDFGNGATSNNLYMSETASTTANLFVYNGGTSSSLPASGSLTAGSFSLLEAVHSGSGTATIYSNGVQKATGGINNINNVSRTGNFIGSNFANTTFFNGQMCEMLIYNAPLTASQRNDLESYFLSKYGIGGSAPTLAAPTITPGSGVYSATTPITLTANPGAAIYYTTNGTTPTTSSTLYAGPFNVSSTSTVQAIAWMTPQFYGTSAVSSAIIQIDSNTAKMPRTNLALWLKSDYGVSTSSSKVTQWLDASGSNNTAAQATSAKQPTFTSNAINGLPTISFNGTSQYFQCPSGAFSNFTAGASVFIVTKPTSIASSLRFFDFGQGAGGNNNFGAQEASPAVGGIYVYNGTSGNNVLASGALTTSSYQVLEAVHSGAGTAAVYTNGVLGAQGTINNIPNVTRTTNYIGADNTLGSLGYYNGGIAEMIIYNAPLSDSDRAEVEGYLFAKYALKVAAPRFNNTTGVYGTAPLVAITADPGASIYYTTDGSTPTTGSTLYTGPLNVTTATTIKAIAVQSFGTSAVSSIYIQVDPNANAVPRTGLSLWLMGDAGVLTSGSNVTQWSDLSNSGNHATQATGANRPTLVTNAVNTLPAIAFNGSSQYLQCPAGLADFTAGASIFFVTKPTSIINNARFFDFANGTANNNIYLTESTSPAASASFFVYNSSTPTSVNSTTNKLTAGSYQLLETNHSGAGSASIYTNNALDNSGTVWNITNISRSGNYIGIDTAKTAANSYSGQIAEILIYNKSLTDAQRASVESYLRAKYNVNPAPTLNPPTFSLSAGVYSSTQTMQLSQDLNQPIYYTTDGTTPTTSSTLYDPNGGGFPIYTTTTVKAISAGTNYTTSSVASITIQVDTSTANVPRTGLVTWLKSDYGVTTSGSNVTNWTDFSGLGNSASQATSTKQPTFVTNAVNGFPALSFDGTSDYMQLPSGMAGFAGATIYIVANPTTITLARRLLDFGSGVTNNNNLTVSEFVSGANKGSSLVSYNGSTSSIVSSTTGLTASTFQVLEYLQNGSNVGTLFTNGTQTATGTVTNINNVTRSTNVIGAACNNNDWFSGSIAEILVYNTALSSTDRGNVQTYLKNKYGINAAPSAPSISPSNKVFSAGPQTVTITIPTGSQVYYTTNGTTPTTSSTPYFVPFTISSSAQIQAIATYGANSSAVTSSFIQIDSSTANVNRTGMAVWLKSDFGVLTSGSNVTDWTDMSGSGNTASQSNNSKRPALVTGAVNGLPTLTFNGSTQFLQSPAGLADFTAGASAFIVTKPTSIVNNARFFDFGNGATSNNLYLSETTTNGTNLYAYSGSTASHVTSPSGVTAGQYQIVEAVHDGTGAAFLYTNGVQGGQGLVNNLTNTSRSGNYFGTDFAKALFFSGEIAEVLIYNTAITPAQRANVESYLAAKYAITSMPPQFSSGTGVYPATQTVTITADPGASIYYTTDGSNPTTSSTLYTAPVVIDSSTTLKAIAVQTYSTSSVATAYIDIDATTKSVPQTGLQLWLKSDYGVQTTGSSPFNYLSQWIDLSGNNNHALPGANAPFFSANAINGLPAVFNHDLVSPPPSTGTLSLPFGFHGFNTGANVFLVTKSLNSSVPAYLIDLGNGATSDNVSVSSSGAATTATFNLYTGATNHTLSATNGLPSSLFELVEAQQSGTTGYIQGNGVTTSGSLPAANNITRSLNSIFTNYNASSTFKGGFAEILVYNHGLTSSERAALLAYLNAKYQFSIVSPTAPAIVPATGSFAGPVQVAIAAQDNTKIYYTVDGTTPSAASTLYTGPVNVYYTLTLKAIAVQNDSGVSSSVSSNTFTLDANQWPAPSAGGPPLQLNLQLPTTTQ
ncbi:MAG: chitobiase/beta-hexosaminidase C-terminal domain-containing protein [Cyanobacteria bacterium SZAS-4]|nr:chitobiase/beta-hexosaminidase C-terminal domain-containing protein [Cyanobacteria bacterium SZAS-4]